MTPLLLALFVARSSGNAVQTHTPFSFTRRAETLDRLVVDLAKATGMHLECAVACAPDVLVVDAPNTTVQALLAEIAKVDAATWEPIQDGWRITPDPTSRHREAREEVIRQAASMRSALEKQQREGEAKMKDTSGAKATNTIAIGAGAGGAAAQIGMADGTPESIAVLKLLRGVRSEDLAVGPNDRVVFSTHPNSMQRPLGDNAGAVISELITKHNAAMAPKQKEIDQSEANGELPEAIRGVVDRMTKPIDGYSKADIVLGTMPYIGTLQATLVLYDNNGKVVFTAPHTLDPGALNMLMNPPKPSAKETPITLSPESKAMTAIFGKVRSSMGGAAMVVPKVLDDFVLDPESHDPLALVPSDQLLSLAKAKKMPLVAVVPDDAESAMGSFTGGGMTVESFETSLAEGKTMTEVESNGWIEVRPVMPEQARQNRTDRAALRKLLRATRQTNVAGLDDIAAFAPYAPSPTLGGVCQLYLSMFVPGAVSAGFDGFSTWEMYRIYGQLSMEQRRVLLTGGRIPISNLTLPSQENLARLVYGPMPQLKVGKAGQQKADVVSQMLTLATGGMDYRDEPTEVLPSGVPSGGYLEMSAADQQFVSPYAAGSDGYAVPQIMGADELAMLKYISGTEAFKTFAPQMPKFDKFKVGSRTSYTLTFHLTDSAFVTGTLKDNKLTNDAQVVAANALPSSLESEIDKQMDMIKKSPLGAFAALGAGAAAVKPPL